MSNSSDPVLLDRDDGIAVITFNRPAQANSLDLTCVQAFDAIANELTVAEPPRVVVLRGHGRFFNAGGNVAEFAAQLDTGGGDGLSLYIERVATTLHLAMRKLIEADAPVIAAVNGPVAGAGLGLVLAADLAYAAPSATFTTAYRAIGFSSDGGVTFYLPRIVGARRASELMLLNPTLTAQQAQDEGLITEMLDCEGEAFDREVMLRARELARGPRRSFGEMRQLLRMSMENTLMSHLAREAESMARLARTPDVAEGLFAKRAKRPPIFEA